MWEHGGTRRFSTRLILSMEKALYTISNSDTLSLSEQDVYISIWDKKGLELFIDRSVLILYHEIISEQNERDHHFDRICGIESAGTVSLVYKREREVPLTYSGSEYQVI